MPLSHLLLALSVALVWGFNFVVIELGLDGFTPLFLSFVRFFLASIPAIFFVSRPKIPFKLVARYGICLLALPFGLVFLGMYAGVTAGLAALLLQLQVFFTAIFALVFLGEKLHPWQVVGALVSFSGIALVGLHLNGEVTVSGFSLVLLGAAAFGIGNVVSKSIGKVDMLTLVAWGSLVAWPLLLILSVLVEGVDQIMNSFQHLTWVSSGAALYLGYLTSLFGFWAWSWLLARHPLAMIAPFGLLTPIIALFASAMVLSEPLEVWKIGAAALVIFGLCINLLGPWMFSKKKS
ncbi:MAG: EamA family transporter [Chlamydiia bacterium]